MFQFGTQLLEVKIIEKSVYFATDVRQGFANFYSIDHLKLDVAGILKEFPELDGKSDIEIKSEAIKRFKDKIALMNSEEEIAKYVIEDLTKHGYRPRHMARQGFRARLIKQENDRND
jgi:hypothetical protein